MDSVENASVSAVESDVSPPNESDSSDHSSFQKRLRMCLQRHRLKEMHALFTDEVWTQIADDIELMWDINSLIFLRLRTLNRYRYRTFEACQQLLIRLASVCNPKEILITFLAELESRHTTEDFETTTESTGAVNGNSLDEDVPYQPNALKAIYKPIQVLISRFGTDQPANLEWALNSLYSELYRIHLPSFVTEDELKMSDTGLPPNPGSTNPIRDRKLEKSYVNYVLRMPYSKRRNHHKPEDGEEGAEEADDDDEDPEDNAPDDEDDGSSQVSSLYSSASCESIEAQTWHMSYQYLEFLLPDYVELLDSFVQSYRVVKSEKESPCNHQPMYQHSPKPESTLIDKESENVNTETIESFELAASDGPLDDPTSDSEETKNVCPIPKHRWLSDNIQNGRLVMLRAYLRVLNWPLVFMKFQRYTYEPDYSMLSVGCGQHFKGWTLSKEQLLTQIKAQIGSHLNVHRMSVKISKKIAELEPNLYSFCADRRWLPNKSSPLTELQEQFTDGVGMLAFVSLVLDCKPGNFVPSVYSSLFTFQAFLPYINHLIRQVRPYATRKGLYLASHLLSNLSNVNLYVQFRDLDVQQERIEMEGNLLRIMRYSNREPLRKLSLEVFRQHMQSLNNAGRFQRIFSLLSDPNQFCGVRSFMLTLYKNFLSSESDLVHLSGYNLHQLVRCMCDMILNQLSLELNLDTVMTFLNLLRFLFMWDPIDVNRTQIWNIANEIQNDFLAVLQQNLIHSKRQYQQDLKKERAESGTIKQNDVIEQKVRSLNSWGFELALPCDVPEMNNTEALRNLICSVDLVESVLVRVREIVESSIRK